MSNESNVFLHQVMLLEGDVMYAGMVHCVAIQMGFGMDVYFGNTMIYFYVKCGGHGYSHKLFDEMSQRDLLSWTSTISVGPNSVTMLVMLQGCCGIEKRFTVRCICAELNLQNGKVAPGIETLTLVISAVTKHGILSQGESLNCVAIKRGLRDHVLQKSLLDLYAKRGELGNSYWLFRAIPRGNGITWGAMMFGFIQSGWFSEAVGLWETNSWLHHKASLCEGEESYTHLETSIINMYIRCGSLSATSVCFDRMLIKDIVTWTSMIEGYGSHGHGFEALKRFDLMIRAGIRPNTVTFLPLLSNTQASVGQWDEVEETRRVASEMDLKKVPGWSCIEAQGIIYGFVSGDGSHHQVEDIYEVLECLSWMKP
ncbi:unnamed protein product [Malus baccata var. baccata]